MRPPASSVPLSMLPFDAPGPSREFSHDRPNALRQQLASAQLAGSSGRSSLLSTPGIDTHLDNLPSSFSSQRSSIDLNRQTHQHPERFAPGIPPSLWMSSANLSSSSSSYSDASYLSINQMAHPRHPSFSEPLATPSSPSALSLFECGKSTAPTSVSSPKERALSELFSDSLLPPVMESSGPQAYASPKVSGSPDLKSIEITEADADPEKLAREDPLATQVWRMYARQKATLPHAQRMENLTWRMMALALKKKKEEEVREKARERGKEQEADAQKGSSGPNSAQGSGEKAGEIPAGPAGGAETATETERGRTIDKGKARVQVVGFDGASQDSADENECVYTHIAPSSVLLSSSSLISQVPMDWRAISRSRSRAPMDWRPASRSRSRPPIGGMADLQNQFKFPSSSPPKRDLTSTSIPIPGSGGRRSPHSSVPSQFMLPAVYESVGEHRVQYSNSDGFSLLHGPVGHPSSLPSAGILARPSASTLPSPELKGFPKHVRKTSFDHTVAKEGIFTGVSGRHQVNGRPRSPEGLIGTKRRADAPHAESMLRADPPAGFNMSSPMDSKDLDHFQRESPFPSSSFSFSMPSYDSFFDLSGAGANSLSSNVSSSLPAHKDSHHQGELSLNGAYSPSVGSHHPNEGLSAAAVAASAAVAETYAQFNMTNMGLEDYQLMNMMYNTGSHDLNSSMGSNNNAFTVDPTQILPLEHSESVYHPSPSSDGWGNGVGSSSNASPEPFNASNASTPPSVDGAAGSSRNTAAPRKIASTKRVTQDASARASASGAQRKGYVFSYFWIRVRAWNSIAGCRSTPEAGSSTSGQARATGEEGDSPPTVCTNCQTTITPLWRRDPEGQPLCASSSLLHVCSYVVDC